MSIASAANDHRLGANEAPPAIISIFLGSQLSDIIDQIEKGGAKNCKQGGLFETGVSTLPKLPKDAGDRNRTSPFAFTGNKFEFRAVGSSANVAGPNTVLNAIVAESLDVIATELEAAVKAGKSLNAAVQELLPKIIKQHKRVIFNGDGYTEEWHKEAEKRGLPNIKNTVDTLPVIIKKETIELLTKYNVYTERELQSRYLILAENYNKTINIEAQLAISMAKTQILPAALKYKAEIASTVAASKAAGVDATAESSILNCLTETTNAFFAALKGLCEAVSHHAEGEPIAHARHYRDSVIPKMVELRKISDKLWPLPTYREMLFIK
jgi:glutamine synthetase